MDDAEEAARRFLRPESVALVGASLDASKFGGRVLRHLLKWGFSGKIHLVHPKAKELAGILCVPSLAEVRGPVDVVVVAVPRERVREVIEQCPAAGIRRAIVFTSGYAETETEGRRLQEELLTTARSHGVRLLGPNCLGLYNAHARVALSANEVLDCALMPGSVAVVSQSGALVGSALDRGESLGVHFAGFASTGNEIDLEASDFIACFATEPEVKVLLAYLEGVRDYQRFARALDTVAAADKPVIIVKAGRTSLGRRTVLSHTGALAGDSSAFDALLRRKGAVAGRDMDEALDMALAFTRTRLPVRPGIAMVSISGGLAGLAADRCGEFAFEIPQFSQATVVRLRDILPAFGTPQNPLDITGAVTSSPGLLDQSLRATGEDEKIGLILLLLTVVYDRERLAKEIVQANAQGPVPLVAVWSGGGLLHKALGMLREGGIATYDSLGRALPAVRALVDRARWRTAQARERTCPFTPQQLVAVRDAMTAPGAACLSEFESKRILASLGLPVTRERLARTPDEAARFAAEIGSQVALKVMSPKIPHKTAVGAIALGIRTEEEVRSKSRELLEHCGKQVGTDSLQGILVQAMVSLGREAIIGVVRHPGIGPIVMVGVGGLFVEALRDVAFRLAPIDAIEAEEMVRELRAAPLLSVDDRPAPSLVDALVRVSWLAARVDVLAELDINPLVLTPSGDVHVLDALMRVQVGGVLGEENPC